MMDEQADSGTILWLLILHLLMVSMMSIGGGVIAVMPEIHRYIVDTQQWMTSEQFTAAFTLAQAAPGPNFLFITLIGMQLGGWIGAIAATAAIVLPPSLLALLAARVRQKSARSRLGDAIRIGLAPVAVGMMLAAGLLLARGSVMDWRGAVAVGLAIAFMMKTRINPVWLILAGAAAGMAGLV